MKNFDLRFVISNPKNSYISKYLVKYVQQKNLYNRVKGIKSDIDRSISKIWS